MPYEVHQPPTLAKLRKDLAHARRQLAKQKVHPPGEGWDDVIEDLEKEIARRMSGQ